MNNHLLKIMFVIVAVIGTIFVATDNADAQRRRGRKARVVNKISKAQVSSIIKNVEERVDRFTAQFNDSLDNSRLNGTQREDRLNERTRDLESATDELRREFDRNDSWQENKAEVRKCLSVASEIDVAMRNRKFEAATENNWKAVRLELNALAKAYGVAGVGGAYR